MRMLRRLLLVSCGAVAAIALLALGYVGLACALMLWHAASAPGTDAPPQAQQVPAWVLSNGVHTDLVFPIRGHGVDWSEVFPPSDLAAPLPPEAQFIAIGWGDREFYLHTPTWADLTVERAWGAALGRNPALLHVTYLRRAELAAAHRLPLSEAQYARLRTHVVSALPEAKARAVTGAHYSAFDAFYEARGRYSLWFTCNQWTGTALRSAGVAMPP
ncbi:TIGR02117 family protein [Variovorax dokdonensis]|uniref:TIGR02117 family protein n=1 Tax=Variovorax dokdonensis TaxID=344883 RepID=A0ABT7N6K2_9BURK|nr:TIGR02117 family protein [Variovorax dokdonensis]MDM0043505.1 TIGR02117 family protein [Variovorax dokdonensis]